MLDRIVRGDVPAKPHTVFRDPSGALLYEECLTRAGFDGPFSILYHRNRPHEGLPVETPHGFAVPPRGARSAAASVGSTTSVLRRRHYRCLALPSGGGAPIDSRTPLLFNDTVVLGFLRPDAPDPVYFVNGDADELYFIHRGTGALRSVFGELRYAAEDYLVVPKGTLRRFVPDAGVEQAWLSIELAPGPAGAGALGLPRHYRNGIGQLRMDAPYSHRDFRRPEFVGPLDEGIRDVVVKRGDAFFGFRYPHAPLDVVGWDGTLYPFALPIRAFSPRVGQVHLPPTVHATFESAGAVVCSFVPRLLDFHPRANPCPYPHASVDIDEVLFYANDAFGSRRGVGAGSLSHHPAGIPHGPHPDAYENAPGTTRTEELAVMLDCAAPLLATAEARAVEDPDYHASFIKSR